MREPGDDFSDDFESHGIRVGQIITDDHNGTIQIGELEPQWVTGTPRGFSTFSDFQRVKTLWIKSAEILKRNVPNTWRHFYNNFDLR